MKKLFGSTLFNILTGLFGGSVFLFFFLVLRIHPLLSIVLGIAAFAGLALLLPDTQHQNKPIGVQELLDKTIMDGTKKIADIRSFAVKIIKPSVKSDVEVFCLTVESIFAEYKKNPGRFKVDLSYYIDSITNIIEKYIELILVNVKTPEITATIEKCESIIGTAAGALTKQLENTIQDDMIDLNAEITVLAKSFKMEGFN